jgi:uncharacterized protein YecT (DUF1311 family)
MKEILFLYFLISGLTVSSQDDIHNIDRRCQKCMSLDSNYTVSAMIRCVNKAQEEWDFKIKKYYKTLKDTLSNESAELLITSQHSWLNFMDKQSAFFSSYFHNDMKGGYHLERNEQLMILSRERALALKRLYSDFIKQ